MYNENTVFIIGAAASIKYGFPLGDELTDSVSTLFGDYGKGNTLSERFRKNFEILRQDELLSRISETYPTKVVEESSRHIHQGLHGMRSVDRYLHVHQDNESIVFLGKLAIASSILKYERQSTLYNWQKKLIDTGISTKIQKVQKPITVHDKKLENLTNTWINIFFNNLSEGYTKDTVKNIFENVSIICFNYDRCIEFYLMELLVITFSLNRDTAANILSTLNIIHPYGTIGNCIENGDENYLPFGNSGERPVNEFALAKRIVTFTESTNENTNNSKRIINAVSGASKMIILGFGFEQMNMDILKLPAHKTGTIRKFYATAYGEIEIGKKVILEQLASSFLSNGLPKSGLKLFEENVEFFDDDCETMLQKIRRKL
ncbi:MAG: hypothetical protein COB24_12890 [Hyphomicrobiales bacterium]|nr:MAG: hypothetical protein COB24_12890 [Hyphomicrobiales bacterium]